MTNFTLIFILVLPPYNNIYVCTNVFGMSSVITSLLYFESITPLVMIASDAAVGLVAYLSEMYTRCVLPFAHIMDLMFSSLFFFNKIRISIALFLSSFIILLALIGLKKTRSCICQIYLCAAAITFPPNFLMPRFKLYVCRNLKACKLSIPDRILFMCSIITAMICADSKLYYSVCSDLTCKCCHLCCSALTLSVRRLPLFYSSLPYLSSASSNMYSSSSGS